MILKTAVVQFRPRPGDKNRNLEAMAQLIAAICRTRGVHLVVFPELATTGYECGQEIHRLAEPFPGGPSVQRIAALARRYHIGVIFGFPEADPLPGGGSYDSAAFIDHHGQPLGCYRKVHLFQREKLLFRAGDCYPVFLFRSWRIGVMICWDAIFPEVARIYALKGAGLLAVPANWEKPYARDWALLTSARAIDNSCFLAAANRVGKEKGLRFFGRSRFIGPRGEVLGALANEQPGFLTINLDPQKLQAVRRFRTQLQERRTDTYGELLEEHR